MKIRIPKGVRIDGRSYGGRFVSLEQLISIAAVSDQAGAEAIAKVARREYDKAARAHQRVADRFVDDPARYQSRRTLAQRVQQEWERVASAAEDFAAPPKSRRRAPQKKAPAKKTTGRKPAAKKVAAPKRQEVKAREWEVGFEYKPQARSKRGSAVNVNLRIRRVDGREFGLRAAQRVMDHVRQTQETPDQYEVAGVDWNRPQWGTRWRSGDVGDMENFFAPMYSQTRNKAAWKVAARFGAIKDEDSDE
jgi:hypothetical protein